MIVKYISSVQGQRIWTSKCSEHLRHRKVWLSLFRQWAMFEDTVFEWRHMCRVTWQGWGIWMPLSTRLVWGQVSIRWVSCEKVLLVKFWKSFFLNLNLLNILIFYLMPANYETELDNRYEYITKHLFFLIYRYEWMSRVKSMCERRDVYKSHWLFLLPVSTRIWRGNLWNRYFHYCY